MFLYSFMGYKVFKLDHTQQKLQYHNYSSGVTFTINWGKGFGLKLLVLVGYACFIRKKKKLGF